MLKLGHIEQARLINEAEKEENTAFCIELNPDKNLGNR